jgi:hypothetical protein
MHHNNVDVNLGVGFFHYMSVGSVANVLEVYAASMYMVLLVTLPTSTRCKNTRVEILSISVE